MTQLENAPQLLIWQRPEWPHFQWDSSALLDSLVKVRHQQGRLLALTLAPKSVEKSKLSKELLCEWQGLPLRDGDFEKGPPADQLAENLNKFLGWWNEPPVGLDGIIRAGIAYFWFMTLLPFENGNSYLAKTLVSRALAQDEKMNQRPYDLDQIFIKNESQIEVLIDTCQKRQGDITLWLNWFFENLLVQINLSLEDKKYTEELKLNPRQRRILLHLASIPGEFVAITNRDCVALCQTSRESIKRDLAQLVEWNLLSRSDSAGRSVCYLLKK